MTEQMNKLIEDNLIDDLMSKTKINVELVKLLLRKGGKFTEISIENSYKVVDNDLLNLLFSKKIDKDSIENLIICLISTGKLDHIKLLIKNNNVFFTEDNFVQACEESDDIELIRFVLRKLKNHVVYITSLKKESQLQVTMVTLK